MMMMMMMMMVTVMVMMMIDHKEDDSIFVMSLGCSKFKLMINVACDRFDMSLGCSNSNSITNISSAQFNSFQFQFNSNSIQFNRIGHQALLALRATGGLVRLRRRTSGFILWPSWVPGVDSRARDCNDEIRYPCFRPWA